MNCPFHTDSRASFSLNLTKGLGRCFSCPTKKGYTLDEVIAKLESKTVSQAKSLLIASGAYEKVTKEKAKHDKEAKFNECPVTMEQLAGWTKTLLSDAAALATITASTGWTNDTIQKFRIGYNGAAYTIPIINDGKVLNVRFYKPKGAPKYSGMDGHNNVFLWPTDNLRRPGPIWLVEGEKDAILANQAGLNALTFTNGAGSFATEYLSHFRGRDVNVLYDIDPAGRAGAQNAAGLLQRVANSVRVVDLPSTGLPPNGDLTDFIHGTQHDVIELEQIVNMTDPFKPADNRTKVHISEEVFDTYLENIISKKFFFKRVRMRVRAVSLGQRSTYLVPKETHLTCNRDLGDQCHGCAANFADQPLILRMRPEYPEIMQLIDNDDNKQKAAIKSLLEIYPKCPKVRYEFKEFQSFYPIVLIPALEKNKPYHSYMMQTAWALDVPAEMNEDYLAEAVVMTNPSTQEMVLICYKLDKDLQAVDMFELTDEMKEDLKCFQIQTASPKS